MKNLKRGFTLIELLVVIAIIGILSSVVLASLNSARSKGQDAKVKAQMSNIRAAAEILYDNSGNKYGTAQGAVDCTGAGSIGVDTNVASNLAAMPTGTTIKCGVTATTFAAYAISASLAAGAAGDYWCIDSTGQSKVINITTPGNVVVGDSSCSAMDAR